MTRADDIEQLGTLMVGIVSTIVARVRGFMRSETVIMRCMAIFVGTV